MNNTTTCKRTTNIYVFENLSLSSELLPQAQSLISFIACFFLLNSVVYNFFNTQSSHISTIYHCNNTSSLNPFFILLLKDTLQSLTVHIEINKGLSGNRAKSFARREAVLDTIVGLWVVRPMALRLRQVRGGWQPLLESCFISLASWYNAFRVEREREKGTLGVLFGRKTYISNECLRYGDIRQQVKATSPSTFVIQYYCIVWHNQVHN